MTITLKEFKKLTKKGTNEWVVHLPYQLAFDLLRARGYTKSLARRTLTRERMKANVLERQPTS